MTDTRAKLFKAAFLLAVAAAAAAISSCGRAPEISSRPLIGDHLRVRMISDSQALAPGKKQEIGVLFEVDPGWHLYAPSRNDSGLPILLELSAPRGFNVGAPRWPVPHRLISEGPLLDHVYEGETLVLFDLYVPADARPGGTVTLECRGEWLVCGTGCIPGEGSLTLTLPVSEAGAAAVASHESERIHAALGRQPVPADASTSDVAQTWSDGAWSVRVRGASALAFIPDPECAPLADLIADGASQTENLTVRIAPGAPEGARITGILAVADGEGSRSYRIDAAKRIERSRRL